MNKIKTLVRKEILDILLSVRDRTTVLFSTHILSDVERICTDVAFLDNGKICVQGKLSDIKKQFQQEEYLLETQREEDLPAILQAFPAARQTGKTRLVFLERDVTAFEVMRFLADQRIPMLKLERVEPTLESLFMEVARK